MGRRLLAARVYQTAQDQILSSGIPQKLKPSAPWIQAVADIPPAEILTRPYPIQHSERQTARVKPGRQAPGIYRPTRIVHPEDELRRDFYRDHPWELARPKLVLELDGQDGRFRDWSKGLRQPGMKLSGER